MIKNKKWIFILIAILVVLSMGIYLNFLEDKGKIVVEILDKAGYFDKRSVTVDIKNNTDGSYFIELPESIESNYINKYYNAEGIEFVTEEEATNAIVLTAEQLENKKIEVWADYDSLVLIKNANGEYEVAENGNEEDKNVEILYNRELKYDDSSNKILTNLKNELTAGVEVRGYIPKNAELRVEKVETENIQKLLGDNEIKVAYDIKLVQSKQNENSNIEYTEIEPEDYGTEVEVVIKGANIDKNSQLIHIKNDNSIEVMQVEVSDEGGKVKFIAKSFSTYVVTTSGQTRSDTSIRFNVTGTYVVPVTGEYIVKAYGAKGEDFGAHKGGKGEFRQATFSFTEGTPLYIQIGVGGRSSDSNGGAGGGYSAIFWTQGIPTIMAAGGGGANSGADGGEGGTLTKQSDGSSGSGGGGGGYHQGANGGSTTSSNGCTITYWSCAQCGATLMYQHSSCGTNNNQVVYPSNNCTNHNRRSYKKHSSMPFECIFFCFFRWRRFYGKLN